MFNQRQIDVLNLIIQQFTQEGRAVGSKTLMNGGIQASSATIRNDMVRLEVAGLIEKEHTSSGRIPTVDGFRYYAHHLTSPKQLTSAKIREISSSFDHCFQSLNEIVKTTATTLARLTNCTVILSSPTSLLRKITAINALEINDRQLLFLMVLDDGNVNTRLLIVHSTQQKEELLKLVHLLNEKVVGHSLEVLVQKQKMEFPIFFQQIFDNPREVLQFLDIFIEENFQEEYFVGGRMNLTNGIVSLPREQVTNLFGFFSDEKEIEELLKNSEQFIPKNGLSIAIGDEIPDERFNNFSLLQAKYQVEGHGEGVIALLGPTNMDYQKMMSLMFAVQRELSKKLEEHYRYLDSFI